MSQYELITIGILYLKCQKMNNLIYFLKDNRKIVRNRLDCYAEYLRNPHIVTFTLDSNNELIKHVKREKYANLLRKYGHDAVENVLGYPSKKLIIE